MRFLRAVSRVLIRPLKILRTSTHQTSDRVNSYYKKCRRRPRHPEDRFLWSRVPNKLDRFVRCAFRANSRPENPRETPPMSSGIHELRCPVLCRAVGKETDEGRGRGGGAVESMTIERTTGEDGEREMRKRRRYGKVGENKRQDEPRARKSTRIRVRAGPWLALALPEVRGLEKNLISNERAGAYRRSSPYLRARARLGGRREKLRSWSRLFYPRCVPLHF